MNKNTLVFAKNDWHEPLTNGKHIDYYGEEYVVIDESYTNNYGTFVLLQSTSPFEDDTSLWTVTKGIEAHPNNRYEFIKAISVPTFPNQMQAVGYLLKDKQSGESKAYSYREAFRIIHQNGATNAYATTSRLKNFTTQLIDTIDCLPAMDSTFWKVPAYNDNGEPYSVFTPALEKELKQRINTTINMRIGQRVRKLKSQITTSYTNEEITKLNELIKTANKITVLSGAGISTLSGIPDYRSMLEGIWRKDPDLIKQLNQAKFENSPASFWQTFHQLIQNITNGIVPFENHKNSLQMTIEAMKPNIAHELFAKLETHGKDVTIITQNVDHLHSKAGSKHVFEIHGNFYKYFCPTCMSKYTFEYILKDKLPKCGCGAIIRPDLVFFGDEVQHLSDAMARAKNSDLFIVIGSSLNVSPINQLPHFINQYTNAKSVIINGHKTQLDNQFDLVINGDIEDICKNISLS
ncbi:hypothetical protein CIB95_11860 [Lottiidibacillus patelloidae]|uniref:protein acetyllysine N-acetyltransferase n=1 Tax=Lottiidibacillus patelloidae TaxID=2670334 RepID=A0A263BRZ6_9BACI|nr:Sir2 family NAD-dependent protein deacetylase [Lottiidibacillus patelloidae]OZM56464.1 hypothetical protein CIB95_11860 [Lottiidibacillus patelloidae]